MAAPCVFGEQALWYQGCRAAFSAVSMTYVQGVQIKAHTVLGIAMRDPLTRRRYQVFRDAVSTFYTEQ